MEEARRLQKQISAVDLFECCNAEHDIVQNIMHAAIEASFHKKADEEKPKGISICSNPY